VVERDRVELRPDQPRLDQRTDLRGHREPAPAAVPIERLDPEGIARCHEPLPVLVPQGEGEDAVQVREAAGAPFLVRVHDRLGVGAGGEAVAQRLELASQVEVVVDLAVDHHRAPPVLGEERLVAAREVHDREAGVGQQGWSGDVHAVAVRAAMAKRSGHFPARLRGRPGLQIE
jgi:hypothetical protein